MRKNLLDKNLMPAVNNFLEKYGHDGLVTAMDDYDSAHQIYLYKSKSLTKQIPICSINYIEIFGHNVVIHTDDGAFKKYGTLKHEHTLLKKNGFVRCSQSFLIPIDKVAEIRDNHVLMTTGNRFRLSRSCATDVIYEYMRRQKNLMEK